MALSTCLFPPWNLQETRRQFSLPACRDSARRRSLFSIPQWPVTRLVPRTESAAAKQCLHWFWREEGCVLSCCYSAQIVYWSSRWCVSVLLDVSNIRKKSRWGVVSFLFTCLPSVRSDSRSSSRHEGRGCPCPSWLELVLRACWLRSLWSKVTIEKRLCPCWWKLHEKAREDFEGDYHPHEACSHTVCRVAILASVSLAGTIAKIRARAWESNCLCGLGHHKVAVRACVSSFLFWQQRKWFACVWLYM